MKIVFQIFIISLWINHCVAAAQTQSLDGTYKTEGSEAGRTVLTISNHATKFYVSYINTNYESFSLNGTLQNPATNFYKSNETLSCGSVTEKNQRAVEIMFISKKQGKEVKLNFKYCNGNSIKHISKTFIVQNLN